MHLFGTLIVYAIYVNDLRDLYVVSMNVTPIDDLFTLPEFASK